METKHTKQYAELLALREVAQIHEQPYIKGYMKAIEETAAPDLLEACKSIVSDFEGDYMIGERIVDNPSEMLLLNYRKAKAAIKKAKGE